MRILLICSEVMFDPLEEEGLESVCTDECRASLESLRTMVLGACDAEEDVMILSRRAYPGVFSPLFFRPLADFCKY